MKSRLKKLDGTARQIEVETSRESVEEIFNDVIEGIRKTAQIPGFRPGRAPHDIIRKNYYQDAIDEVKRRLIPQAYQDALKRHSMSPVSYPELSDVAIAASGSLVFTAKFDIHPEVGVVKYKGLKLKTRRIKLTSDEIDKALNELRKLHAEFVDIDSPVEKGDFGVCDAEMLLEGKPVSKKREGMWIEADKETSMLGVGEELIGLKKGDKKDIKVVLPENYPNKKYAGCEVLLKLVISQTKRRRLAELNDDFAKKAGKDNMDELKEQVRLELTKEKEALARSDEKRQIMEQLLNRYSFALPKSMVARQLKVFMERAKEELTRKGLGAEAIKSHEEDMKKNLLKEAEAKVKLYFILDEIAGREDVNVNDEEIDSWIKRLADSYGQKFEDAKKYYKEHDLIDGLREQLKEEKTLDFLLSEAEIIREA